MILDIRVGRGTHGMRAEIAEAQGVAVRRGTRSTSGCDRAARRRRVLDYDRLAKRTFHMVENRSANRVRAHPGRQTHDYRNRPRRVGLCRHIHDAC
jgi:hypothetical protein